MRLKMLHHHLPLPYHFWAYLIRKGAGTSFLFLVRLILKGPMEWIIPLVPISIPLIRRRTSSLLLLCSRLKGPPLRIVPFVPHTHQLKKRKRLTKKAPI
jgi:hypothetical protein